MIRICLNFKSQRTKKIEVFSQGTDDSKNLRCETLYGGDYKYVDISSFAVLGIKLWLEKDGDFNRNDPLYSFKFIQSKAQIDTKCYHLLAITSYPTQQTLNFCIFVISNNKSFIFPTVESCRSLERKVRFFQFLGI